jgi:DegV family protein with EDD domain
VAVRIVTDSAAALSAAEAGRRGIHLVPIRVVVGESAYRDGELPLADLVSRVGEGISTSGPPPGAFLDVLGGDDGVVVVTVASSLSSTYTSAGLAGQQSGGDVRVVDTGTAAGAQALVAIHAAEVAASGATLDEVEAEARRVSGEVKLVGALETLEYLVRGGRVNGLIGGLAGSLGVRPMFELAGGHIRRLRPAFGRRNAVDRLFRAWHRTVVPGAGLHVVALHAMAEADATALLDRVAAAVAPADSFVSEFGAGMVAHTGPGLLGLSWWWEL